MSKKYKKKVEDKNTAESRDKIKNKIIQKT